jgi:hypothetical protein
MISKLEVVVGQDFLQRNLKILTQDDGFRRSEGPLAKNHLQLHRKLLSDQEKPLCLRVTVFSHVEILVREENNQAKEFCRVTN